MKKEFLHMKMINKYGGKLVKILLFLTTCFTLVDTRLFIYPSLSYSLLAGITTDMTIIIIAILGYSKKIRCNSIMFIFCIAWIVYIFIHLLMIKYADYYRGYYLINSILYAMCIALSLKANIIKWNEIENCIILFSILGILCVYLQYIGIFQSENPYIVATGVYDNPSSSAIWLVGASIIIFERIFLIKSRMLCIVQIALFGTIILLQCRTAWIGELFVLGFYLLKMIKHGCYIKRYVILSYFIFTSFVFLISWHIKLASSQSRAFIWKNSIELIRKNYIGYGYGLFEKYYNLQQSEYFKTGKGGVTEKENANFVSMPYNDYIESTIEGGVVGGIFYSLFYILMIYFSVISRNRQCLVCGGVFCIMATINFIYTSVGIWLLVLTFWGYAMSKEECKKKVGLVVVPYTCVLIMSMGLLVGIVSSKYLYSQLQLTSLHKFLKEDKIVDLCLLKSLKNNIGTSEVYYTDLGKNYFLAGDYNNAIYSFKKASEYTAAPTVFYLLWQSYVKVGDYKQAFQAMSILENMQPILLTPKLCMLKTYSLLGDKINVRKYADIILKTKIKVPNEEALYIKKVALWYKLNF